MNFEKISLLLGTNYVIKANNHNKLPLSQVKVQGTILRAYFHHCQYDQQDIQLYIELKKQTSKVWNYLLKT